MLLGSALVGLTAQSAGAAAPTPRQATDLCSTQEYRWNGEALLVPGHQVENTGVIVPGPAAGETVTVTSLRFTAYDRYPAGSDPTRAETDQMHEQFRVAIGDVESSFTPDLPDSIDEGAVDDWYSGVQSGTLSIGAIAGGEISLRHYSLYLVDDSPNSVRPTSVTVVVERCTQPEETTTTSTAPPEPPAPTNPPTSVDSGGPVPPVASVPDPTPTPTPTQVTTTTAAASLGPVPPASQPTSTTTARVASQAPALPATGSSSGLLLTIGAGLIVAGGVLVVRSRRTPA